MTPNAEHDRLLHGRRIAVPESRELDVFATLLERRGALVLRCPLIDIRDAPDPLRCWAGCGCSVPAAAMT